MDKPKRKRAPGAGRKPVVPGGVTPVTVTLSESDVQYLQQIDRNISAAVRTIIHERKDRTMNNYIHVYLRTDEDNLMGSAGWGEYDSDDSIAAFGNAVETAVIEAFPGADVDVTTYAAHDSVDTDIEGVTDDDIVAIAERVWNTWEWLRK